MKVLISESQVDKLKSIFSSLYDIKDYEGVCSIMVDYDEFFDKIVLNVFFDKKFAIKNGRSFNKVKNSVLQSMVVKAISWLNKTPLVNLHFEDCDEINN
jgi:hypothetical protein